MRLAVVVNSFPSLSETFIFNKVLALRAAGVDVTVQAQRRANDAPLFAARLAGQKLDYVEYGLLADGGAKVAQAVAALWMKNPGAAAALMSQSRQLYGNGRRSFRAFVLALPLVLGKFDIIHFEYSGLAVSFMDALPLLHSAKLLTSCRGAAEQITPLMEPARADKLRQVFAQMDRVHCVSDDMQRTVERYGLKPEQAFVNRPAIDPAQFSRSTPYEVRIRGPYRLLSVGRLHWKKGLDYGLLAVKHLLDEGYDVYYDILGGGEEEERLRFAIDDLKLGERVSLKGRQSAEAVRAALENSDVYLLPSVSEGLSNAALEAMAMELPLVTTTAGGMAEAVTDGVEGFLVAPWQPAAMADRLKAVLADGEMRRRMGQAGRRRVEQEFSMARQVAVYLEQYGALMGAPRAGVAASSVRSMA